MPEESKTPVEGEQVVETPVETKPVETGLGRMIKSYGGNGSQKPQTSEPSKTDNYDYSVFKDINDEDYQKIDKFLNERKVKDSGIRHHIAMHINDVKKNQRLVSARETELNQLKNMKPDDMVKEYQDFINDLKTDPTGAFSKYKDKYGLPDSSFVIQQAKTGGDVASRVEEWQQKNLIPDLEKKHKIEPGTFVYDATEAYKPRTPSYEYRIETERKEREFKQEFSDAQTKEAKAFESIVKERDVQLKQIKESYYKPASDKPEDVQKANEEFESAQKLLDSMWEAMQKGDFSAKANPFAILNIFRGVHFDALVNKAVESATNAVHAEYQKYGLRLPNKPTPTDPTKVAGQSVTTNQQNGKGKFSPLNRTLSQYN